ncbi:SDR family NAD(P)-dependent oxidoreductase [Rhodoligotrophos defluvii]|uniref:SDR family NAD(P)-dependent oxidoreductase n=1 Tax=Rhodoligotrophos defluvii TaxID=2561934 RepID=UPI0010CA0328|nr:SDR family NAD(P)-dependent oxidoreductase [Rhodoligotrophos defluvii]
MARTPEDYAQRGIAELISLRGRNAVITGGARGLGYAIARRFAEAGANILVGDKNAEGAAEAAGNLASAFGVKAFSSQLDVADSASMAQFADEADSAFETVDIWVNNAGIFPAAVLADTTDDEWDLVQDVNLRGTFLGCRAAARRMRETGRGVIINITSVSGYRGRPSIAHYVAAKHGVVGLTKALAMELGPLGVRVLAVAPAMTETPGLQEQRARYRENSEAAQGFKEMEQKILANFPLRRFGHPDDIARVVLFAASDLAAYVTATTIFCDGGISAF